MESGTAPRKADDSPKVIRSYRDLLVWQKGMDLVTVIYQLTKKLPSSELYGLTSQMRRAALSIPANISEGHIRRHTGDFIHHLSIALGSVAEVETHLEASIRLNLLTAREIQPALDLCAELTRMLFRLIEKLKAKKP